MRIVAPDRLAAEAGEFALPLPARQALGLAIAGIEDQPARRQRAAEGGELVGGLAAAAVHRRLAVPDQGLWHRAEGLEAAAHPPEKVGRRRREDERRRERPRVAERGGDQPASRAASAPSQPGSWPRARRGRTGRARRGHKRCAGRCAAARAAGGPRARSRRRSSCRPRSRAWPCGRRPRRRGGALFSRRRWSRLRRRQQLRLTAKSVTEVVGVNADRPPTAR